jgi:hypothetical protein
VIPETVAPERSGGMESLEAVKQQIEPKFELDLLVAPAQRGVFVVVGGFDNVVGALRLLPANEQGAFVVRRLVQAGVRGHCRSSAAEYSARLGTRGRDWLFNQGIAWSDVRTVGGNGVYNCG